MVVMLSPVLWSMDERAIKISDFPDRAFDSSAEKEAVAALLDRYNHPPDSADKSQSVKLNPRTHRQHREFDE